jgi:hypothetical protein
MSGAATIELKAGDLTLALAPTLGGAIAGFRRIEADPVFGHLIVYVPPARDFFAVEPVSHMNNAVNRPDVTDNGLRHLAPGERLTGSVRFSVEAL